MTKKTQIAYIFVGIILVGLYWLIFSGNSGVDLSEVAQDAQEVQQMLEADTQATDEFSSSTKAADTAKKFAEYNKLLTEYNAQIENGQELDLWYYKRALAHQNAQQYRLAIADYTNVIEINPKVLNAYYNRGLTYFDMGAYAESIGDFTQAAALKQDPRIYNARGLAYVHTDQLQQALQDYNRALEIDPNFGLAYFNRGTLYERKDDFTSATEDYTKSIEFNTEDAEKAAAYYRRAIIYFNTGAYEQAIKDLDAVIAINDREVKAYQLRSKVYEKLGNLAAAADDDTKAQTLSIESFLSDGSKEE